MIDGSFTCPTRDGRVGEGGCTFCRNDSFAPAYCRQYPSITQQIEAGKAFFAGRYPQMEYVAYFQSYSSTYAPVEVLRSRYDEALSVPGIVGLILATRPDCLGDEVLSLLSELHSRTSLKIEIGVESCQDHVLRRIHRGHDFACAVSAIRRVAALGIPVGVHLILGLPGETEDQMLAGADTLSALPISSVKLHQLQIFSDTPMAEEYRQHPEEFHLFSSADDYALLAARFAHRLAPGIEVERIVSEAPPHMLIAPRWGLKPQEVQKLFDHHYSHLTL